MTSIIRRSYVLLRVYPGMRKKLILHDLKSYRPTTALRCISVTSAHLSKDNSNKKNEGSKAVSFYGFAQVRSKEKKTYLDVLRMFVDRDIHRRGHVEFIYAAMKHMEEFGVEKDLEVYKNLINVLPKGKFIPENTIQAEFMHYPKQQQCAIDVLEQMENNGVIPDREMQDILLNIFGKLGFPLRKYWRMMYWMPKFKNASPWPLPEVLPNDSLELAKLAIERITSIDLLRKITIFQAKDLEDSIDDTWIVSGMSIGQKKLLNKHASTAPIYVEGPFRLWLKNLTINYFILRGDPVPKPDLPPPDDDDVSKIELPFWKTKKSVVPTEDEMAIHEQEDGTIFAVCATGTSSRDSLLSWIRFLQKENDILANIPIIFKPKSPLGDVVLANNKSDKPKDEGVENKVNKD